MIKKIIRPELFYLALLAFGINLCFAFQVANLSSIFKFLGAGNNALPLLWLVPPLTGLIIQPLIGQLSDDTVTKFGKRRPYIVICSILAALSFAMLPLTNSLLIAMLLTWLIDSSLNGCSEGLRTLTADLTFKDKEFSRAFAIQAFFAGIGGAVGSGLPYLIHKLNICFNNENEIVLGGLPINLKVTLVIISVLLLFVTYVSIKNVKERNYSKSSLLQRKSRHLTLMMRTKKILYDLYKSIKNTPPMFKKVCIIHGFTWIGMFIFWLYFTVALAQMIYGLPSQSVNSLKYNSILQKASLDASVYFTVYQYVSVVYSIVLYFLSNRIKLTFLHALSLMIGGVGMSLIFFAHSPFWFLVSAIGVGIMWGSLVVLPYAIAIQILPKGRIGTYLGIFNICITFPQLICGLLLTPLYTYIFNHQAVYLLMLGATLIFGSAVFWLRIQLVKHFQIDYLQKTPEYSLEINSH